MSTNGIIIVLLRAYSQSKRLIGDPDVISRGLIYGSEQNEISRGVIEASRKAYEEAVARGEQDRKAIKRAITGALFRYFDRKLDREPMIIPLIIDV
jgi:ribonuclease J